MDIKTIAQMVSTINHPKPAHSSIPKELDLNKAGAGTRTRPKPSVITPVTELYLVNIVAHTE